jgi:hypothetical protein
MMCFYIYIERGGNLMKTYLKFAMVLPLVALLSLFSFTDDDVLDTIGGINRYGSGNDAIPGSIDFDPPSLFIQTIPCHRWLTLDTGAYFYAGNGCVLNEASNFNVTGHSYPNFLAWNSTAVNWDGTVPALPAIIWLPYGTSYAEMNVGCGLSGSVGALVNLYAFDSSLNFVGYDQITCDSVMQTMSVSAKSIYFLYLDGPSRLVADDLNF